MSNLIAKIDLKNDWFLKFFQISRQSNKNNLEKKNLLACCKDIKN